MKAFRCRVCRHPLFFENSSCDSCGTALAYSIDEDAIVPLDAELAYVDGEGRSWSACLNRRLSDCTWLALADGVQCTSCVLTRTRPSDDDGRGLYNFVIAERAKRHLTRELHRLGLPLRSKDPASGGDPADGVVFDLLSSVNENVVIGHDDGVVTIDVGEGEDAYRERTREQLEEPYRTMLGHFRHEIGHYIEWQRLEKTGEVERARQLFGDETRDYRSAIEQHYASGPPEGWRTRYISAYATMHPYEDFAESWAHVLHITDTLETAHAYGLVPEHPTAPVGFRATLTQEWMPLATALNVVNRSMGNGDLYPFVLPDAVIDKLEFAASVIPGADGGRKPTPAAGSST